MKRLLVSLIFLMFAVPAVAQTNALMKVGDATVKRVFKDSPAERAGITPPLKASVE